MTVSDCLASGVSRFGRYPGSPVILMCGWSFSLDAAHEPQPRAHVHSSMPSSDLAPIPVDGVHSSPTCDRAKSLSTHSHESTTPRLGRWWSSAVSAFVYPKTSPWQLKFGRP